MTHFNQTRWLNYKGFKLFHISKKTVIKELKVARGEQVLYTNHTINVTCGQIIKNPEKKSWQLLDKVKKYLELKKNSFMDPKVNNFT